MITLQDMHRAVAGNTQVRLSDFHTLEAAGKPVTVMVKEISNWHIENFEVFGLSLPVAEDTTLMLMVRFIKGEMADCRLFRESSACMKKDCDFGMIVNGQPKMIDGRSTPTNDFVSFGVTHDGEEGSLTYQVSPPFPLWGVKKNDGSNVAICEYTAVATETDPIDENYWAKYGFVEWYSEIGVDGERGLRTLWFGWDINADDFEVI